MGPLPLRLHEALMHRLHEGAELVAHGFLIRPALRHIPLDPPLQAFLGGAIDEDTEREFFAEPFRMQQPETLEDDQRSRFQRAGLRLAGV